MQRTKAHILESKSEVHVHSCANINGWIFRRKTVDYGIDAEFEIVNDNIVTGMTILLQLRSTASKRSIRKQFYIQRCNVKNLKYWMRLSLPVVLIIYVEPEDSAYWIWTQKYVEEKLDRENPDWVTQKKVSIKIPRSQKLDSTLNQLAQVPILHRAAIRQNEKILIGQKTPDPERFLKLIRSIAEEYGVCNALKVLLVRLVPIEKGILELRNTKIVRKFYRDYLNHSLNEKMGLLNIEDILLALNNPEYSNDILKLLQPSIGLEESIEQGLGRISFKLNNLKKSLHNPVLLWDCSCEFGNPKLCNVHVFANIPKQMDEAFGEMVKIQHNDVNIVYHDVPNHSSIWPPSFESLYFGELMLMEDFGEINGLIDIGCGTGYLGISIAKNTSCEIVAFLDWLPSPLIISWLNWYENVKKLKNPLAYPRFICEDGVSNEMKHLKKQYDLAICNPPFLPDLGVSELNLMNTVFGTDLLQEVIINSNKLAKKTFVAFSSIVSEETSQILKEYSGKKRILNPEGYSMPFRVRYVFESKKYFNKLRSNPGLSYYSDMAHLYYHRIYFMELF